MAEARRSWREVRDAIRADILSGRLSPGDRLPRDEDLARRLNCARSTVQRAMQDLSQAGLVERRRRGGTRVRPDPVTRATFDIPITRHEVEARGARYGHQLIRAAELPAPPAVVAAFDLHSPERTLYVEALHLADGRPYILEERWIATRTVPEIRAVDLTRISANEWLVLNRPYSRCDLRFYAIQADPRVARLMGAAPGAALLVIERTTWIGSEPITTVRAITAPGYQLQTRT